MNDLSEIFADTPERERATEKITKAAIDSFELDDLNRETNLTVPEAMERLVDSLTALLEGRGLNVQKTFHQVTEDIIRACAENLHATLDDVEISPEAAQYMDQAQKQFFKKHPELNEQELSIIEFRRIREDPETGEPLPSYYRQVAEMAQKMADRAKKRAEAVEAVKPPNFFDKPFLPALYNNPVTEFLTLSRKNFKPIPGEPNTLQWTAPNGRIWRCSSFASFGQTSHKLLLAASVSFAGSNIFKSEKTRTHIRFSMTDYAEQMTGDQIKPRQMASPKDQAAENRRAETAEKNFLKQVRKDLLTLSSIVFFGYDKPKAKEAADRVQIITEYHTPKQGNDYMIEIVFGDTMAYSLNHSYIFFPPAVLWKTENRNPNAFEVGLAIVRQSDNLTNKRNGRNQTLTVKTLLENAPGIQSFDDLQAKGRQRDWRKQIKDRLETALDAVKATGYIIRWQYRDPRESHLKTFTPDQAAKLSFDDWYHLDVDFTTMPNPDQEERLERQTKKFLAAEEKRKEEPKKKTSKKTGAKPAAGQ